MADHRRYDAAADVVDASPQRAEAAGGDGCGVALLDVAQPENHGVDRHPDEAPAEILIEAADDEAALYFFAHPAENEVERALAAVAQQRAAAVLVASDVFLSSRREYIAVLALRHALPTICNDRIAVVAGQLMSYGSNSDEMYQLAGTYVGRILKGEKPADLPVMQPTKFELFINLKTARALGLDVPPMLLARAYEVIE